MEGPLHNSILNELGGREQWRIYLRSVLMNSRREMSGSGSSDKNGFFSKSKADMKNKSYRIIIRQELKYIDKNQTAQNKNRKKKLVESIKWLRSPETWRSR